MPIRAWTLSSNVLEVHGSLRTAGCPLCHREYVMAYLLSNEIPLCNVDGAVLKPDIVLYEGDTELFLTLGSSLRVYPVKELPKYIQNAHKITKAIVNNEATPLDYLFDYVIHDDIVLTFQ